MRVCVEGEGEILMYIDTGRGKIAEEKHESPLLSSDGGL